METSNPIWSYIIGQAPVVVVLALLVYYMFKFFTTQMQELNSRWETREMKWKEEMAAKDAKLEDLHERMIEITKIAIETQTAIMSKLNEVLKDIKSRTEKLN